MAANEPINDRTLPTAFRGYAREPVDALLEEIERSYRSLISERDELRSNLESTSKALSEATAELDQHAARERAVAEALIEVERLKGEAEARADEKARELRTAAERDAGEIRREAELQAAAVLREAQSVRDRAETEAEEVLRNARVRADQLVEEMQRSLQERHHQAEEVLDDAREQLGTLVRDLLERIGPAEESDVRVESESGADGS